MKMEFKIPFTNLVFRAKIYHLPTLYTVGITNRTTGKDGNRFVFFADYDMVEEKVVEEDAEFFQSNYNMGPMIIMQSSQADDMGENVGNYHLIGFRMFTFPEVKELIKMSRCDNHFKYGYKYQQRCWVLRIGPKIDKRGKVVKEKPHFYKFLPAKYSHNAKFSGGHIRFFSNFSKKIDIKSFAKKDIMDTGIELINYVTK